MELLETNVLRGPNQWSTTEKNLIAIKIDAGDIAPHQLENLRKFIEARFPELTHLKSQHVTDSLPLPSLVALAALGLQTAAGMPLAWFTTRSTVVNTRHIVVFAYTIEQAGLYAADAAVELCAKIAASPAHVDLTPYIEELERLRRRYGMGPTSSYLLDEVKRRGIPYRQFDYGSLITLGHGNRQKKIRTAVTDSTSALGLEMAGDKEETKKILAEANIPVPKGIIVRNVDELRRRINEVKFPLVLKPLNGNHGRGVTTDINDMDKALFGFEIAERVSTPVIVEEFVKGDDYRFLVINFQLVAAALRMPAFVKGDGKSTISELIDKENTNPQRGETAAHVLAKIKVDDVTKKILSANNLTLDSVLPDGKRLILKDTANISAGGTATDVTDQVHPENKFMVERVAKMFNLDICGIDIMATAIDVPITRDIGAIIEVNAGPGLRMHSNPQSGPKRDVAKPIIDMLFPTTASAEIPIIAITGTNGKTTTTRLIAFLAARAGYKPGYCTSDGVYINGHLTYEGDCTGFLSAQQVLFDPTIDFAVLECARGGLLRSGLGFDNCDISIVTNISEDHLGMKDVYTINDLYKVKKVVPHSTKKTGYAILNADDHTVYNLASELKCNIALFSLSHENERIKEHVKNNGVAAYIENGNVVVIHGIKTVIDSVDNIPLTFGGRAEFMVRNVLAACLAGVLSGFESSVIRDAFRAFTPSPELTPGRMNTFDVNGIKIFVDYVHNTDGFSEIKKFLSRYSQKKIGVISAPGDRRNSDISDIGMLAAGTFDHIIIRNDQDTRGRTGKEVNEILLSGIREVNAELPVEIIPEEEKALEAAFYSANPGDLIFVCADKVKDTIELVEKYCANPPELNAP